MKLTLYDQPDVFGQLKPEWNDLLFRSTANTVFGTWEWHTAWWEAYQPGQLWVVVCRDEDGRLMGIAPWCITTGEAGRVVSAIGCVDVTDYVDVIVDATSVEVVLRCFAAFLADHRTQYDAIDLCNIPQESPTLHHLPELLSACGFQTSTSEMEVCPVIPLPSDWEGYLNALDKKQRHELRRKLRRVSGGGEKIEWYTVGEEHDLSAELDKFLMLMAASDGKKALFLQDEKNVTFFRAVMPHLHAKGWLQLIFLTIDGEPAAAYLNFDYARRILVYNSGYKRDGYDQLSPGIVLLANNIRSAIERGYSHFDFLRGNEPYKYHMGGQDTRVYRLAARQHQPEHVQVLP